MKKKGQALVEFVIILPIFLLLVIGMIDFGKIIYEKYKLQNDLDIVKELTIENKEVELNNYLKENRLNINYQKKDTYTKITIDKKIQISLPFLENPYIVKESVNMLNE